MRELNILVKKYLDLHTQHDIIYIYIIVWHDYNLTILFMNNGGNLLPLFICAIIILDPVLLAYIVYYLLSGRTAEEEPGAKHCSCQYAMSD